MNYILKNENALYYECGYSCDNAIFINLGSEKFFLTDSRYQEEAKETIKNATVIITNNLHKRANKIIKKAKIKKLIYDPRDLSIYDFEKITNKLDIKLKSKVSFSHKKRIIKSEDELNLIREAVRLGSESFDRFAYLINKYGLDKDEYELTYMAETVLSKYGRRKLSFEPIIAINENASKPHATPTKKKLKKDDLLLVDAGLKYKRYCSDRTRTVSIIDNFGFSLEQKFKTKKIQKAYDTVLKAHDNAIEKARSGMKAKEIDALTRDIIDKAGFGKYYIHSTGHGVGLDIHEMPYISSMSKTTIEDNMVFTIEPGIYIPNEFGIRIEDMVVMRNGRVEVL